MNKPLIEDKKGYIGNVIGWSAVVAAASLLAHLGLSLAGVI